MKTVCPYCGVHFPLDFEASLTCGYWQFRMMDDLPVEYKQKIWDWEFAAPLDEIYVATGIQLACHVSRVQQRSIEWPKIIPFYEELTEEERQSFQKDYISRDGWDRTWWLWRYKRKYRARPKEENG